MFLEESQSMERQLYLILPNIRSAFNVGAMFRTADACRFEKIFLVGYTAAPPHPKVAKVALGADTWVPFEQHSDLRKLISKLKQQNITVAALELTPNSLSLNQFAAPAKVALLVGNEVEGLSPEILQLADITVHLPMLGRKESLNVAIAAGIAMYQLRHSK